MKTMILLMATLMVAVSLWAATPAVWKSSYTATAETTQNLCGIPGGMNSNKRGFFHGVCISSGSTNASITIYASSGTTNSPIAVIDSTAKGCYTYDVIAVSSNSVGLTYSTVGTAKTTILYDCF